MKLTDHCALILDVYGTLIDWESAIHHAFVSLFPNLTREEILVRYAGAEGNLQMQFPNTHYARLLELAYRQLTTPSGATAAGVTEGEFKGEHPTSTSVSASAASNVSVTSPPDDAQRFGESIPSWVPFSDTLDALHRLKKHFALVVLSNVDNASFAGTHAKLCTPAYPGSAYPTVTPDSPFSLILTAQQVGVYKPNPAMLANALRQLSTDPDPSLPLIPSPSTGAGNLTRPSVDASRVLVVANSLRHDIIPATQHGLRSVWISRDGVIGNERNVAVDPSRMQYPDPEGESATGGGEHPYTWRYETMGRLADAVERELRAEAQSKSQLQ